MKKLLMITFALTLCAGTALADVFGIYSDPAGTSCALTEFAPLPSATTAYVKHYHNFRGSTAAAFGVLDESGLIFAGYQSPYLVLGTLPNLTIGFGSCIAGDHTLLTVNWFAVPDGNYTCANRVSIVPATESPLPGEIVTVLCDNTYQADHFGGVLYVGPDAPACIGPCGCPSGGDCHIAVAKRTWGSIKALYR
jgi:hypothetical protein